jgi:hypothetical protein
MPFVGESLRARMAGYWRSFSTHSCPHRPRAPEEGILYATYLREQGRLGGLVGDREAAIAAYRRYLRLRARHEPALDRDVATVRAALEKLERQSSGR